MAFPKQNRLRKSSMIQMICKKGASWKTPFFRIKFLPAKNQHQIAIVTSKKLEKRAVYRNRMRRKISSCFEKLLFKKNITLVSDEINNISNILLVIFPTEKILFASHQEILQISKFSLEKIQEKLLQKNYDKKHSRKKKCNRINRKSNTRNI